MIRGYLLLKSLDFRNNFFTEQVFFFLPMAYELLSQSRKVNEPGRLIIRVGSRKSIWNKISGVTLIRGLGVVCFSKLFSKYRLFAFSSYFNKNWPKGAVNFDTPTLCFNFLFYNIFIKFIKKRYRKNKMLLRICLAFIFSHGNRNSNDVDL